MKQLKCILLVLILLFPAISLAAGSAKTPAVLLQEARYAEEIDGNLDKAIGLYEQIIKDTSANGTIRAQAMYQQGLCFVKKQDEAKAQVVLAQLVEQFPQQTKIVERARVVLSELADSDPAALMPSETLVYVELGSPGTQIETILNMLKGTPFENPLAALGQSGQSGGQQSPAQILNALLNPSMLTELKKIRGLAIGVTEIKNNPSLVAVLYPGKSDAFRGLVMAGLGMAGQPAQPIEDMNVLNIQNVAGVAYDDTVIIVAQPMDLLTKTISLYKKRSGGPNLAENNKSFAQIGKKIRRENAVTVWVNVDQVYEAVSNLHDSEQLQLAETFLDPKNIEELLASLSIKENALNLDVNVNFKPGHNCLAYDLIHTPNLNRKNFAAVPSNAVAVLSFALNDSSSENIAKIRKPLERLTGLDIGREIFSNIEQVTVFAVPNIASNTKDPMDVLSNCFGIAITSSNPKQTRQILNTMLGAVNTIGQLTEGGPLPAQGQLEGRYILPVGRSGQPVYCYVDQSGNTTFLSISSEVIKSAMDASRESKSALTSGVLSAPLEKLSPNTSKLVILNAGGLIKIADAVTTVKYRNPQNPSHRAMQTLAEILNNSFVSVQTDEKNDGLGIHVSVNNIPPLKDVFAQMYQISRIDPTQKVIATVPQPGYKSVIQFSPTVSLQWKSGAGAVTHKVYVGDKPDDLKEFEESKNNRSELKEVKEGENYYWRVDEVLPDGEIITGDTWSFNTGGKLVGWWKFDGNADDSSGNNNNGTIENGPEFVDGAIKLDGEDDYVSLPIGKLISSLGDATFAVWVNVDASAGYSPWQRIFDFGSGETTNMFLTPRTEFDNVMRFAITVSGYGDEDRTSAPTDLPAVRHHVAVTMDSANKTDKLYLDGKLVAINTNARFTPSSLGVTANNWLGKSQYSNDPYFKGTLDDFRIYNYVLSDKEISELCQSKSTGTRTIAVKSAAGTVKIVQVEVELGRTNEENLVGWWKFDGNADDSSGKGNPGTLMNGPQWVDGKIGGALKFDGEDDYVSLPLGSLIPTLKWSTIATWVNFSNSGGAWQRIFDFGTDTANYMYLSPRTDSDGPMRVAITAGDGQWTDLDADSGTLPTGWHHVAVVLAPGNLRLYLDGELVGINDSPVHLLNDLGVTTNNWLGRSQYPTDAYFNGELDDFRIYNRGLSDNEIAGLFQSAFNSGTGTAE